MRLPHLETERLLIRPLTIDDLAAVVQLLDVELAEADFGSEKPASQAERAAWLQWTVLNYEQLARLYQPPYGERAVTLRTTGQLIGLVGYVPCLAPFDQYAALRPAGAQPTRLSTPEFGLYYALAPAFQRQGYAAEAAGAMIRYAFNALQLRRIIATTSYDNAASIGVMRKLGMRVERNPYPDPPWLQIVGVLNNPASQGAT
jgi:RimJ/RimL family protein N-acetyltransferase